MMDSLERSLAELRVELSPGSADKARLRALILAPVPGGCAHAPTGGAHARSSEPLTRWAALKAAGTLGLAAGALVLGAGMGAGFWLGRGASAPGGRSHAAAPLAPVPELRPAEQRVEPAPLLAAPTPPPAVAPAAAAQGPKRAPPPRPRTARKGAAPNPLSDELALLRRVERALRNADPALALALLRELDERFPESRLVEEREAARMMAECRIESPEAQARARGFLNDHPASVYRQRVQLACEIGTPPVERDRDATPMKDGVSPGD